MPRARTVATGFVFTIALVLLGLSLAAPGPPRVNVRWTESATAADRRAAEGALHLDAPERVDRQTWSYRLSDPSPANIAAIVRHLLAEDTHHIDRDHRTLAPRGVAPIWEYDLFRGAWFAIASGITASILCAIGLALSWPSIRAAHAQDPTRVLVAGLLIASAAVRLVLVSGGGQLYWNDEVRYRRSQEVVTALAAHDTATAIQTLDRADHPLFRVVGLIPASVEFIVGENPKIPAGFLALFSVLNIWFVIRLAHRLQAGRMEALLAGALFAASASLFYFSRHLFPYDVSMSFGLLAVYAGCARPGEWRSSIACGALAACAFLTYTGYWTLGGAACVIHVLDAPSIRHASRRALMTFMGLILPIGAVLAADAMIGGGMVDGALLFARGVTQGSYDEGWRLPVEYLWHSEHLLLVLWLGSLVWWAYRGGAWEVRTVRAGIVGLAFIYSLLVVCSVGLHTFVVYGRLARQLVPFYCLVTAAALAHRLAVRPAAYRTYGSWLSSLP